MLVVIVVIMMIVIMIVVIMIVGQVIKQEFNLAGALERALAQSLACVES